MPVFRRSFLHPQTQFSSSPLSIPSSPHQTGSFSVTPQPASINIQEETRGRQSSLSPQQRNKSPDRA